MLPNGKNATTIDTLSPLLEKIGFEVVAVSSFENKVLKMAHMLWSVFKYRNYDYLLIDTYSTSNFYYAIFSSQLARIFNLKYIPILHGGNLESRLKNYPKLSKLFFDNAFKIVSPSIFLKSTFEKYGYIDVLHIPNSIELEKYINEDRNTFKPKILWVRALAEIYNPFMALKVVEILKASYPDMVLTMVGPDKDGMLVKMREFCEMKKLNVHFTGKISKNEIIFLAQSHDIFINTTHVDNLPVSLLEAMALKLPIVSTNVGGISYLIENEVDGLLVDDNDVNSMVINIKKIIENPIFARKLVYNSYLKIIQYDWQKVKYKWVDLLN